jgi:hypothetical protein
MGFRCSHEQSESAVYRRALALNLHEHTDAEDIPLRKLEY